MKNQKFPLPTKYWIYVSLCAVMMVLLFVNIFVCAAITGGKELHEFGHSDWIHFAFFVISELLMGVLMFFFAIRAGRILNQKDIQKKTYYEQFKYDGIEPGEYDYVWFDFSGNARAKILKQGNSYLLYVEEFDEHSENWIPVNTVSCFDSIDDAKKSLFYDFDFYCDENTTFDKHGDEEFKQ